MPYTRINANTINNMLSILTFVINNIIQNRTPAFYINNST